MSDDTFKQRQSMGSNDQCLLHTNRHLSNNASNTNSDCLISSVNIKPNLVRNFTGGVLPGLGTGRKMVARKHKMGMGMQDNVSYDNRLNSQSVLANLLRSSQNVQDSRTRAVRKTFSIPQHELSTIAKIRDIALNRKIVLSESEVLRLGLMVVSELSENELAEYSARLEKLPMGRPAKQ